MFHERNKQKRILQASFFFLGGHVGVWAVLLPYVVIEQDISGSQLGFALGVMSLVGLIGLPLGGYLADKISRKLIMCIGLFGTGLFFLLIPLIANYPSFLLILTIGGFLISFYDLFVNTVGSDYEALHQTNVMHGLHAIFSLGAAICAMLSGVLMAFELTFNLVYVLYGICLITVGLILSFLKLPAYRGQKDVEEEKNQAIVNKTYNKGLITYVIIFACATISLCFIIDASLEGFLALYLTELFPDINLITSIGITTLFTAAFVGRLLSNKLVKMLGDIRLLALGSLFATIGLITLSLNTLPIVSAVAIFIIGLGVSPIVPIGYSVAGRVASVHGAKVMSLVTSLGYLAMVIGPIIVGFISEEFSLRATFLCLSLSSIIIFILSLIGKKKVDTIRIIESNQKENVK